MSQLNDERKTLEILAEQLVARYRRGERPALSEYIAAHPELADEIRELFPTLMMMEELAPSDFDSSLPATVAAVEQPHPSLGDYRIVREIGRGGMGVVYEAEQLSLGRRVALKVLRHVADDTLRQRFHREARAAAQLHHTNIVPVFEVGEDQNACWYAMQLILGQGLDLIIEELRQQRHSRSDGRQPPEDRQTQGADAPRSEVRPPVDQVTQAFVSGRFACPDLDPSTPPPAPAEASPGQASFDGSDSIHLTSRTELSDVDSAEGQYYRSVARIGRQAAEALAHAHARGIIHRDVKPSNLLLDMAGVVWITDFGLAKTADNGLTSTGDIVGTLRYMAPERFKGEGDERADVYGLGLTLYELLVLQPAFAECDRLQLIDRIKNQEPPRPRALDRRIPRDLETVVLKAIAKEAKRRYPSAETLADDLRRFLADEPIAARRTSQLERLRLWVRRNPAVASLLGIVFLLLTCLTAGSIAAALWQNQQRLKLITAEEERTESLYQSLVAQANATRFSRRVGQRYATLEAVQKAADLVRERHMPAQRLDELRNLAIAALVLPDFRTLRSWEGHPGGTFSWSADDQLRRYCRVDMEGKISLRWIDTDEEIARLEGWRSECWLEFSPGGRFLWALNGPRIRIWGVSSAEPRLLGDLEHQGASFHPDGRHLLVLHRDGALRIHDLEDFKRAPSLLANFQPTKYWLSCDPSGTRLAARGDGKLQILDVKTGKLLSSIAEASTIPMAMAWHPSGNYLALVSPNSEIHIWDLKRVKKISVLKGCRNGGVDVGFTPDGERLLSNGWEGTLRLWSWRTGRQLLQQPGAGKFRFRADGCCLIHRGGYRLSLVELNTGREYRCFVQQSNAGNNVEYHRCRIHPDGRVLAAGMSDSTRLFDLETGDELESLPQVGLAVAFQNKQALLTNGPAGFLRWPIQLDKANPNRWQLGPPSRLHEGTFPLNIDCDHKGEVIGLCASMGAFIVRPGKSVTFLGPHADVRYIAISPEGKYAATGVHSGDEGVKVWDTETGKMVVHFPVGGMANGVFSPDGKWLSLGGNRGGRIVRVGTWEERPLDPAVIFSPDSSFLAVRDIPTGIRLLEPNTGRELARLSDPNQEHSGSLAFTPDGGKLVDSSDPDRAIRVWDLRAIRSQLAEMKLDWDSPPLPPAPLASSQPLQVRIDLGDMNQLSEAAKLVEQAGNQVHAKKHQEALAALLKAVQIAPSYAMAHNNLAWLLLTGPKELRDPDQALREAKKAVELEPKQLLYVNTLGVALYYTGQFADAIPVLERSFQESNGKTDAFDLFFLAMCHHRLGDATKARDCHERGTRWFQLHKSKLSVPGWLEELTAFQAESASVLAQAPGKAKK